MTNLQPSCFHLRCQRQLLCVSWRDHITNAAICKQTKLTSLTELISRSHTSLFGHISTWRSCPCTPWRSQGGGGAVGAAVPPQPRTLSCTAYCYCTILRFTGHRSILGKWNIRVMRCGSFTSGNTQTPNLLLTSHSRDYTHKQYDMSKNNRLRV